jgi:hypothetical protein
MDHFPLPPHEMHACGWSFKLPRFCHQPHLLQLVSCIDFRYITDFLTKHEAMDILRKANDGKEAREAFLKVNLSRMAWGVQESGRWLQAARPVGGTPLWAGHP